MKWASIAAGGLLAVVLIAVTAVASGYLGMMGARLAGMPAPGSVGFDLGPQVYFAGAGLGGAILFGPVAAGFYRLVDKERGASPRSAMLVAALAVTLFAFPASFACYRVTEAIEQRRGEEVFLAAERQGPLYDQIRADPTVVLRKRWFAEKYGRRVAYEKSLSDEKIAYDARTIGGLYAVDKTHAWQLLSHRAIDDGLLSQRFDVALEELTKRTMENEELFSILMNPKAKKEWFVAVAASEAVKIEKYPALNLLVAERLPAAGVPTGSTGRNPRR